MFLFLKKAPVQFGLFLLFGLMAYWPALMAGNVVNPDAQYILEGLQRIHGPLEYIKTLISFNTLDFQPIRDVTLFLDLRVYTTFGYNSGVLQNLIWWIAACWFLMKLLRNIFSQIPSETLFLICLAFLVYPLFGQTVAWGIARKHILCFFFIVLMTEIITRERHSFSIKKVFLICFLYTCSVLSQPIGILWPVWAFFYFLASRPQRLKQELKLFIPLGFLLVAGAAVNFYYYKISPNYLANNVLNTGAVFEISDKVLAIGHYSFQIFFPYLLSFNYSLGHYSTLLGLGLLLGLVLGLRFMRVNFRSAITWSVFSFLPLMMVLRFPQTLLYDTYLLLPGAGVLILLLLISETAKGFKYHQFVLCFLILGWTGVTNSNSRLWRDELALVANSYDNRPNCMTAATYMRLSYENEKPAPVAVKKYLYEYECRESYVGKMLMNLQTYMLFYEEDLSLPERIAKLRNLAAMNFFSHAALVSLFIEKKMDIEAEKELLLFNEKWKGLRFKNEYIPIVAKYLHPYCVEKQNAECLRITKPFLTKADSIYYK